VGSVWGAGLLVPIEREIAVAVSYKFIKRNGFTHL
jgi:hypothetical protein